MLRVSIHSALPSQLSRFNRTDWVDIGYQTLKEHSEYKVVLFEAGLGSREPVFLQAYPRWSSSLWDLVARALALAHWSAPRASEIYASEQPGATDGDGNAVDLEDLGPTTSSRRRGPAVDAGQVHMPPAEDAGTRCAFAKVTTATITHFPISGAGGRRLGTLTVAQDRKVRGLYGASIEEDARPRRLVPTFFFSPRYLSPAELICRTACFALTKSINALPAVPELQMPAAEVIDGVPHIKIHQLEEPALTGFQRWLKKQDSAPKPSRGARLGRVPVDTYTKFLTTAI
jgi:hypothetical protein